MALRDFDGQTWVAFSDLCGTKRMYKEDQRKAAKALDRFYNTVYQLQERSTDISALVVSDCAVFWHYHARLNRLHAAFAARALEPMLGQMQRLHRNMIQDEYLLRTTIAFGHFRYQRRLEMPRIRKDMIVGGAYMESYAANDRVTPGAIIVIEPDPSNLEPSVDVDIAACAGRFRPFLKRRSRGGKWEFVWWASSARDVARALKRRTSERKRAQLRGLIRAYRDRAGALGRGKLTVRGQ